MTSIGQARKPLAIDKFGIREKLLQNRAHRIRPQKQGFMTPARMQQPVGKNMAALFIPAKLNFINDQAIHITAERHRLYGTAKILCIRGDNFFLTRDQRHPGRAQLGHHFIIVLARQQPQGKARHARAIAHHPVHRIIGFTRIGRPQNKFHLRVRNSHDRYKSQMIKV